MPLITKTYCSPEFSCLGKELQNYILWNENAEKLNPSPEPCAAMFQDPRPKPACLIMRNTHPRKKTRILIM